MSSAAIITIILVLLAMLVAFAFISQSVERRRKQQQRITAALRQRAKDFRFMASGFPQGFLPKELSILVLRCLLDVTEQLSKLQPNEESYIGELEACRKQLDDIKRQPAKKERVKLENPQQVKEVKALLQGLNTFIAQQAARGRITDAEHKGYEKHIKRLVVQITVDSYIVTAKQSLSGKKERLALHYYTLARKLLFKEGLQIEYQALVGQLNEKISELESLVAESEPEYEIDQRAQEFREQASSEWDEFEQEQKEAEDTWKKKTIYD